MSSVMKVHIPGSKYTLTCNATCHKAKSSECTCICGGKNHGCKTVGIVPQTFEEVSIPERFFFEGVEDELKRLGVSFTHLKKPVVIEAEHTDSASISVRDDVDPTEGILSSKELQDIMERIASDTRRLEEGQV